MNRANQAEDASIRRFERFEWLSRQIEQAAREADAYGRLEYALQVTGEPAPLQAPRHHLRTA